VSDAPADAASAFRLAPGRGFSGLGLPGLGLSGPGFLGRDLVLCSGVRAGDRFRDFFAVHIRNPHTRAAYARAAAGFCDFAAGAGLRSLGAVEPVHVAAWVEALGRAHAPATVKQRLAGVRMLFDWLVLGQVVRANPAAPVRGPRHVVRRGKTPVLDRAEARRLLESIGTETLVGLRDRAFIGLMVYSFARVGAAVAMRVEDFYPNGRRWWVRLREKGAKQHELPAHHNLEAWLLAYVEAAGIADNRAGNGAANRGDGRRGPLFRAAAGRTGRLTDRPLLARNALDMVHRRARAASIATPVSNHTFRATGITAYLENGGTLERAQAIAAHESPRTTKLYDRTADQVTLDEIERIIL
jgi:integrase/recombinase XerC